MTGNKLPAAGNRKGRLIAVNPTTGDFAWQVTLGITEQLPLGKQNTGRPALAESPAPRF